MLDITIDSARNDHWMGSWSAEKQRDFRGKNTIKSIESKKRGPQCKVATVQDDALIALRFDNGRELAFTSNFSEVPKEQARILALYAEEKPPKSPTLQREKWYDDNDGR